MIKVCAADAAKLWKRAKIEWPASCPLQHVNFHLDLSSEIAVNCLDVLYST